MDVNHSTNPTSGLPSPLLRLRDADVKCSKLFLQELEEKQLLQHVCNIWVETGGFRMVGFAFADGREMIGPMLYASNRHEISATDNPSSDRLVLQEVSAIAIRTGQASRSGDVLSLPVRENDSLFGAFTVRANQAGEIDPNTIELLDAFSRFLARALAGLHTRLQRKEIEDALRHKESGIRQLIDAIPQHILINAPTGVPVFANKAWIDYHGQTLEEMQSLGSALDSVHPDDIERLIVETSRGYSGKTPFQTEFRVRRKDGQFRWFLFRLNPLEDEHGNIVRWYSSATDIEDLKNAEARLRLVVDTTPALIHTARPDGYLDYFNRRWLDYLGMRLEDLQGWGWTQVVHPSDVDNFLEKWRASIASGTPFEAEARVRRADGEHRTLIHRKFPMRNGEGKILKWYGSSFDIEDRKRAEEALRKSEEQWRDVFENNPTMYFMVNVAGKVLAVNPFGAEQLGYKVDELVGQSVLKVISESDRQAAQKEVAVCLEKFGQSMSWELRKIRKDGSLLWVRETARAVLRESEPVVLIACEDITESKDAQDKIREKEIELRQMLDFAPQLIFVEDTDGNRLYANQAVLDYYGFTHEEWLTSERSKVFYPGDWERILREVQEKFLSGLPHETEGRLLKNDGSYRWFLLRRNPLRDEKGRVVRWYVAGTDIEDRKQAEQRLQHENVALREEIDKTSMFEEVVGTSSALKAVLSRVSKVAPADSTVLITGETGTGKELLARAVHKRSPRSSRAFVSVNLAAIPRDLIASELFGHEKGAFTGAAHRRLGRFELAEGGTIFLDEVGELPAETQIALLRVLQEHEFERVGGTQSIQTDVRVIAATNRDLNAAIATGAFRSDLYYRLNVFPIQIPSLRERREDIPLLVEYFIERYARKLGKSMRSINRKSLELLQSYSWPGNIRELQNVIERSVIVCESEDFSVDESWLSLQPPAVEMKNQFKLSRKLATQERELIEAALRESGGRVSGPSGAAAKLGLPGSTLETKIRSLKINKNRFKT